MIFVYGFYVFLNYRNLDDVDKTMDEINEQTENMKQIQKALSAPMGAATFLMRQELFNFFLFNNTLFNLIAR